MCFWLVCATQPGVCQKCRACAEATKCSGRVGEWEVQRSLPCRVCTGGSMGRHEVLCLLVPATQHGAGCGVQFVRSAGGSR